MGKIIKFEASWCQPCKQLKKEMEGLEFPIEVLDVDTEEAQELVSQYNVRGVPTLVFLKDKQEVDRTVGLVSRFRIDRIIEKHYRT